MLLSCVKRQHLSAMTLRAQGPTQQRLGCGARECSPVMTSPHAHGACTNCRHWFLMQQPYPRMPPLMQPGTGTHLQCKSKHRRRPSL